MNDRLKFRVFDNSHKKYWNNESYNLTPCLTPNSLLWFDKIIEVSLTEVEAFGTNQNGRFILEQCTGLKDKNGTLIYEGDIVKDHFGRIMQVIWFNFGWNFLNFSDDGNFKIAEIYSWIDLDDNKKLDVEIIGNIHENHELLKD